MSTRCQIRFEEEWEWAGKPHKQIAQIYRHSDGYPDGVNGVVADVREFLKWYEGEPMPRQGDISYACADFIYFLKKRIAEHFADDPYGKGWEKIGHGIENPNEGIHGDEEYLYIVTYKDGEWHIKVSGHNTFPRFDSEDTAQAFEKAEWEFEGTVEEAYEKYVVEKEEEEE